MAKKNLVTYGLIAAGVVAAIIIIRRMNKKSGSSVYAGSPIKQSEAEYEAEYAEVVKDDKPSILETAGTLIKTIFPKRTAEQKAAKKSARMTKRTLRKNPKASQAVKSFLNMPRVVRGIDDGQIFY
jgi:hypothetical protein